MKKIVIVLIIAEAEKRLSRISAAARQEGADA